MSDKYLLESPSSEIRIFLSSTFRDFMQERDLLVKEIFPELRRKARARGVDVVDVDLRWGITEEESEQGKVIPICLGEIDRCRPYFIGMLGDRYGWIPPADQYSTEVIERQPWLQQHLGGVSVTELEILHGVLNDPAMAGRAFFYFRDSAWSQAQTEPGFVCATADEQELLEALKQRIRVSGFPLAESLADPQAIADQIGADLWQLIEQQYPEQEELDGLAKEERKHASYRNSRLRLYLGGESYIENLETWIESGQQSILITGESGSGKSALIANWMEAHQQTHPEDLVYAHHLGCSNDANAIRPLLERLIETAKQQLPEIYGNSLDMPRDWWELIAKASEALQSLGRWAQKNKHRWIWVLDGLDRLPLTDQKALPWLPLTNTDGVVIVASALDCPAREILLERQFTTLTIGPLKGQEQDALIQQYLSRYTKQLIVELRQKITAHRLGGSPLFLRVLLEELRQCGRYETLAVQLDGYLRAKAIDDLYELVLERLEADGNSGNVRKVMSAIWASRAGLSEEELQDFTGLAPLQWAPIDLALEQAFGRNGNRLVFDHDYLHQAVEDRYLPSEEAKQQAHNDLADWFEAKNEWDERKAEEFPWQLKEAHRLTTLYGLFHDPYNIAYTIHYLSVKEVIAFWNAANCGNETRLEQIIEEHFEPKAKAHKLDDEELIGLIVNISDLFEELAFFGGFHSKLISLAIKKQQQKTKEDRMKKLELTKRLAWIYKNNYDNEYQKTYLRCISISAGLHGRKSLETMSIVNDFGLAELEVSKNTQKAFNCFLEVIKFLENPKVDRPLLFNAYNNLGMAYLKQKNKKEALLLFKKSISGMKKLYGTDTFALNTLNNLACIYSDNGQEAMAESTLKYVCQVLSNDFGDLHPYRLTALSNLGEHYVQMGNLAFGFSAFEEVIRGRREVLGDKHPDTLSTLQCCAATASKLSDKAKTHYYCKEILKLVESKYGPNSAMKMQYLFTICDLYSRVSDYSNSINLRRIELAWCRKEKGSKDLETIGSIMKLAQDLWEDNQLEEAESLFLELVKTKESVLGPDDTQTYDSIYSLARVISAQGRKEESIPLMRKELEWSKKRNGIEDSGTLLSLSNLANDLAAVGEIREAETLFRELLAVRERSLGADHPDTIDTVYDLAVTLTNQDRLNESILLRRRELNWCRQQNGEEDSGTLMSLNGLAMDLRDVGQLEEAEIIFRDLINTKKRILKPNDFRIGCALGDLAKTLGKAGKLKEAEQIARQCYQHRLEHQGNDDFYTNRNRLDLAGVLHKLSRNKEAINLLQELQTSLGRLDEPNENDQMLINDAATLLDTISEKPLEET